jgi:glycosyltransferase involved in cell wall biosynthesis
MKSMKVAMVAGSLARVGGVPVFVESLSAALLRAGVDVRVFGVADQPWLNGDDKAWRGAPAKALPFFGPEKLGYAPQMARILQDWAPDVVHCHSLWTHHCRSVLQWHRATNRPYVLSPHGTLAPVALGFSPLKKLVSRLAYVNATMKSAASLAATSQDEAEDIKAQGLTQDIAIIPCGVEIDTMPIWPSTETKTLLFLGRIHPKKGIDILIRAWTILQEDFPDWRLEIVGQDEVGHSAQLHALCSELQARRVALRGPRFGADKGAAMSQASLFVLPSLSENFALTIGESLLYQVPVITTKGTPWEGLIDKDCGWWIDHGVGPLEATLRQAMSLSTQQRRDMGERGRAWMLADFSWDNIARQFLDLYQATADTSA